MTSQTKKEQKSTASVALVTDPDLYLADVPKIACVCDSHISDTVTDVLAKHDFVSAVYWITPNSDPGWVANVSSIVDYVILDCKKSDYLTGFFIDKPNVFYYNNTQDYSKINLNKITDAIDFVISIVIKED